MKSHTERNVGDAFIFSDVLLYLIATPMSWFCRDSTRHDVSLRFAVEEQRRAEISGRKKKFEDVVFFFYLFFITPRRSGMNEKEESK